MTDAYIIVDKCYLVDGGLEVCRRTDTIITPDIALYEYVSEFKTQVEAAEFILARKKEDKTKARERLALALLDSLEEYIKDVVDKAEQIDNEDLSEILQVRRAIQILKKEE